MIDVESYHIRPYQASDENFIYATWLKGLYYGNKLLNKVPQRIYYSSYHKVIESILKRPSIQITCACLKEDPDVLLSYCVSENKVLHWIFTKKSFRKLGIAKSIIPSDIEYVSTLTDLGDNIKPKIWVFNPFMI